VCLQHVGFGTFDFGNFQPSKVIRTLKEQKIKQYFTVLKHLTLQLLTEVVSWSTKWVYFVLPDLPKFLTCMTFGRTVLSNLSSRVGAELSRENTLSWKNVRLIFNGSKFKKKKIQE